jgi:uncharacterized membrane protein SirB2
MVDYYTIRQIHITCAALSGGLFLLRGIWMLRESPMLQWRAAKILPHLVDTLLLASALVMVAWSGQYPFVQNWLTAKVFALIVYIVLGSVALKRGRTKTARVCAFVAALAVFVYIVLVATTKRAIVLG